MYHLHIGPPNIARLCPTGSISAQLVPEAARMDFLPRHFDPRLMLLVESKVYAWMERLCRVYNGGYWNYFDLSNGGAFMSPKTNEPFVVHIEALQIERRVTAEVAGLIATSFALRSLLWAGHRSLSDKYHQLLAFVAGHPEHALIHSALE